MRTSLNKIQEIEGFVLQSADVSDRLVFEACMIINPDLIQEVSLQKEAYALIQQYSRRKLKAELEDIHQALFTQPVHHHFREKIRTLFKL